MFATSQPTGRISLVLCAFLAISGCSEIGERIQGITGRAERVEVSGTRFLARLTSNRADRRQFQIAVTPVVVNPEAAQEAGRYEATKYCIQNYGSSDAEWIVGPDTPVEALTVIDDSILLSGRCTQR